MKCPLCNVEMRITKVRNILEDDDTPDKETKLFIIQELSCLNKDCPNNGQVVQTVKNEQQLG